MTEHDQLGATALDIDAFPGGVRSALEAVLMVVEEPTDHVLATLVEDDLDQGPPGGRVDDPEGVHGDRAVLELDALAQLLAQAPRDWTANLGEIGLGHAVGRMLQPVRQLAVIGDEEQPFGLGVEASDVEQPARDPVDICLLYTSPSPRDRTRSRMPSSA